MLLDGPRIGPRSHCLHEEGSFFIHLAPPTAWTGHLATNRCLLCSGTCWLLSVAALTLKPRLQVEESGVILQSRCSLAQSGISRTCCPAGKHSKVTTALPLPPRGLHRCPGNGSGMDLRESRCAGQLGTAVFHCLRAGVGSPFT